MGCERESVRARERERERESARAREQERDNVCVCVCVFVGGCLCESVNYVYYILFVILFVSLDDWFLCVCLHLFCTHTGV